MGLLSELKHAPDPHVRVSSIAQPMATKDPSKETPNSDLLPVQMHWSAITRASTSWTLQGDCHNGPV